MFQGWRWRDGPIVAGLPGFSVRFGGLPAAMALRGMARPGRILAGYSLPAASKGKAGLAASRKTR